MSRRWAEVMEVARAVAPAEVWRSELARRLRTAVDGCFATVVTCAPGDWGRMSYDADPPELAPLVDRIQKKFIPRVEAAGEDWRFALRTHGPVYTPLEVARARALAAELREEVLRPAGINGYVTAFFTAGDPPRIVGLTAIGGGDASLQLLARVVRPLGEVARAAGNTLSGALAMAEGCFARARAATELAALTARERQIAVLASQGFANVNAAAQLGISETTVAVHLRKIYAKLGVHSRVELAARVGLVPVAAGD